jgi:4,5-DOPA dioxygenase extradiol
VLGIGRALARWRDRGILLLGSGGVVHNLQRLRFGEPDAPAEGWAAAFESWLFERLKRGETDKVLRYRDKGPGAALAAPTTEHFDPVFFALGARRSDDAFRVIHSGIGYGNLSLAAFAFQPD